MKKITKVISVAMAGLMVVSSAPVVTASAATVAKPKISVSNSTKGAKQYVVMRKGAKDKKYTTIKTISSTKTKFVDKKAKSGKEYTYTVKAVNGKISKSSKAKKVVYLAAPKLKNETDKNSLMFYWNNINGAKSFEVYRATVNDSKVGKYELVQKGNFGNYFGMEEGKGQYRYKVRAIKGDAESAFSYIDINFSPKPAYKVKVGSVNKKLAKEFKDEVLPMMEVLETQMGVTFEYSFVSENPEIFTLDEDYNIIGVAEGEGNILFTVTSTIEGVSSTEKTRALVAVTK